MTDQPNTQPLEQEDAPEIQERRAFLRGLGKWSQAVIGGVLLGGGLTVSQRASAGAWVNRRGGYYAAAVAGSTAVAAVAAAGSTAAVTAAAALGSTAIKSTAEGRGARPCALQPVSLRGKPVKMKNAFPAALGVLSLLGVTATTIAAEEKAPATVEKMAEKLIASPKAEVGESITTTAQVQAVDLKKREVTLKDKEGNVFTIDVPPEVRRLAEIKPGDLIVTEYRQALAVGLHKTDSSTGIRVRRESVSVERAGMDQPPGGVMRETVEVLANIIAIDKAKRWVTIKGAKHMVVLKVAEDTDLDEIKVGDEILAEYVQELAINLEPAPAAAVNAWSAK